MTQALGTLQNAIAGVISMLTVLSAMALGYLFDGERFSGLSALGAGLTLVGVSLGAGVSRRTSFGRGR
jgi:drug/metabolite transporter (DMT)-like permease